MNFILYMLGQAVTRTGNSGLRPSAIERQLRKAAVDAASGDIDSAANLYEQLLETRPDAVGPKLVLAQLRLLSGQANLAAEAFDEAINSLLGNSVGNEKNNEASEGNALDRLIASADRELAQSHFARAIDTLQNAMETVETLLAANAGLIVSDSRMRHVKGAAAAESLIPLAELGDLLLRMFARANLASNLAASLRKRHLRDDLALWAAGRGNVDELLTRQFEQLRAESQLHPSHVDLFYRMGFLARTLGRMEDAAAAFSRVLILHPHHLVAAALFAATNLQLKRDDAVMPMLAMSLAVGPETLARYLKIAEAAADLGEFDRTVEKLVAASASPHTEGKSIRANLAMALSELGLLDSAHGPWRNPMAPVPQS